MIGVLAELARTFALLSLVSIGGVNALLPEIHRQVVDVHGWMTDAAFASAFGVDDFAAAEPHLRKWIRESAAARSRVDAFFRENPGYAPQPAK